MCLKQTNKQAPKHAKTEKQIRKTDQDFDLVGPEDWKYWYKSMNITTFPLSYVSSENFPPPKKSCLCILLAFSI